MSVAVEVETIKARARRLYEAGVCPGCGAPLVKVAGVGNRHWKGGQEITSSYEARDGREIVGRPASRACSNAGVVVLTRAGDPSCGILDDSRLCEWSADELTVLVHLGSGLVAS